MNKKVFIITGVMVLLGIGLLAYFQLSRDKTIAPAAENQGSINMAPATDEEKQYSEQRKQDADAQTQSTPTNSASAVKPTITYAGQFGQQVEIGGLVTGVFEEGGTCTAKLSRGSKQVTKQVTAVMNANSMNCPAMIFPISELSETGTWTASVDYISPKHSGTSDPRQIEVK